MVYIYFQLSGFATNVLRKISRKCKQICGNSVVFFLMICQSAEDDIFNVLKGKLSIKQTKTTNFFCGWNQIR